MTVKYAELDRLQRQLLAHSDRDTRTDVDLLKHATLGARGLRNPVVAQLVAKVASRLYHEPTNALVRQLCRGALIASLEGGSEGRDLLPFALQLVHRASYASPSPLSIRLPDLTAARALECLDRNTQAPEAVDRLADAVRDFVERNDAMAGGLLFARLLHDLEFLRDVVRDDTRRESDRRTASGALTYFVEAHDAIDDDLGVVGILDDAYVAQLACENIEPSRRVKTAVVDGVLAQWPFLTGLCLDRDGNDWSPSEFVLLNLALAYGPDAPPRNAIVLPTVGDLPLWLGVLASIGALYESLDQKSGTFRPKVGDFISVAGHEDQVAEVMAYLQSPGGTANDPAAPESAQLVALKYLPRARRARAAPVRHVVQVKVLEACVPAAERVNGRRTTLPGSRSDLPLGPLEVLFKLDHPARFGAPTRHVVVVAPLVETRDFLSKTSLLGRPLTDLIPCGRALPGADYSTQWWSSVRSGEFPLLTVARDAAEAAAVVSRRNDKTATVLLAVEKDEWAAASLGQLDTAHIVALLPQCALDAQSALRKSGFKFLDWTPELDACTSHRPRASTTSSMDRYEIAVRRQLHADVHVHGVELDSVETSLATLKALSTSVRDDYSDEAPGTLSSWSLKSQRLFFDLGGAPLVVEGPSAARALAAVGELRSELASASRLWTERCSSGARSHLAELERLVADLGRANPKAPALADLLGRDTLAVRCSSTRWEQLKGAFPRAERWVDGGSPCEQPVAIFEWPGAKRVIRLLLPPIGDPTHLVFYRWEREGLQRVQKSRDRQLREHWGPSTRPEAWHLDDVPLSRKPSEAPNEQPRVSVVEEWVGELRRQCVIPHNVASHVGDPVVEALPVYFAGSQYALFVPDAEVLVATNLMSTASTRDARLHEKAARQLRIGDVVVRVAGSERDAIREAADARLRAGARELARTWHGALSRLRERSKSDRAVCTALRKAGCDKADLTMLWWLRSETQIGPHDEADVDVIARATGDSDLLTNLAACKKAIHVVRGEHHRASHELATRALRELETRLGRGDTIETKIELGDRVELLVVEAIDEARLKVPRSTTNIIQDGP